MTNVQIIHRGNYPSTDRAPYHVHGEGCKDIAKYRRYALADIGGVESFDTLQALVEDYYGQHIYENDCTWDRYAAEFRVFPCAKLAK